MDKRIIIPISQSLLNKLRCFEHESHSFKANYLEEVNELSTNLLKESKLEKNIRNFDPEKIILAFHYYLALIENVNIFLDLFEGVAKTEPLNVQGFNSTNIFNVHSLFRALQALRSSKPVEEVKPKKLNLFKGFNFVLGENEKDQASKTELVISSDLLEVALNSRGKFDLSIVSILCTELNKAFSVNLRSFFVNSDKKYDLTSDFNESGLKILSKFKTLRYTSKDWENHARLFIQDKDKKKFAQYIDRSRGYCVLCHILS